MNKLGLLCVVMALFVGGCGKKKCSTGTCDTTSSKKMASADGTKDIPLYKEEAENLLEDSDIADFAFVDDETAGDGKDKTVAVNDQWVDDDNSMQDESMTFDFKAVHFDFNKNDIRPDQKKVVLQDVQIAKEAVDQGKSIVIEGHCDQIGSAAYNLPLSQRRAEAMKKEMVKSGVSAKDIKTVGYGYERPVVWSDQTDRDQLIKELAANRRAEMLVN